jgi:WD40 repeat protein
LPEEFFWAAQNKIWAAHEHDCSILIAKGRAALETKDWLAAKAAFEQALFVNPGDLRAKSELDQKWTNNLVEAGTVLEIFHNYSSGQFTLDGQDILLSGRGGEKRIWNVMSKKDVLLFNTAANEFTTSSSPDHHVTLGTISDEIIYSKAYDRPQPQNALLILRDFSAGQVVLKIPVQELSLSDAAYSADGKYVVTVGHNGELYSSSLPDIVKKWDVKNWTVINTFVIESGMDSFFDSISSDGQYLMVGARNAQGKDTWVKGDFSGYMLYDTSSGRQMWKVDTQSYGPFCISQDSRNALVGDYGTKLDLMDLKSGRFVKELSQASETTTSYDAQGNQINDISIFSVALSPDGRYAFAGCRNADIKVFNLETSQLIQTLHGRPYYEGATTSDMPVGSLQVSHDGRYLLSNLGLATALWKLWDGDKNGE